jgi:hypothetical protein
MEAAYAALKGYSQTVAATGREVIEGSERTGEITTELRYRAPNRMMVRITSSVVGGMAVSTDGHVQIAYLSKRNLAQRLPAPSNLKGFLKGLKRYQIVAVLDPLYFLAGEPASKLAGGFQADGQETVEGVFCDRVVGVLNTTGLQSARSGRITFWIDRKTSLLKKTLLELRGLPLRVGARTSPGPSGRGEVALADKSVTEVVKRSQIDPPLKPSDLSVVVPPGVRIRSVTGSP